MCVSVCVSVCLPLNIFQLEYLRYQWANRNEILSEPSLGWGYSIPVELSSVCVSVCLPLNIFKLEYLRYQWANRNEILSEPSLWWGKGCNRFWARSDRNSGVHGNGLLP